ncbi:reactive intermediate/imine deaminase [Clostridia bacterium]|nr:reactive intermediate/imine deaminase [Clostridia bacterium]
MKQEIKTNNAPAAIGPYSQGIAVGTAGVGLAFLSGQLPVDPVTGAMPKGIAAQTEQVLKNIKAVLDARGGTISNVVKTTVFLQHMKDFAEMNAVYASFFSAPYPARSTVEVAALPKGALVEIECIAL